MPITVRECIVNIVIILNIVFLLLIVFYFFNTFKGLEPGTVVITRTAVNALLEPFSEQVPILSKCFICGFGRFCSEINP